MTPAPARLAAEQERLSALVLEAFRETRSFWVMPPPGKVAEYLLAHGVTVPDGGGEAPTIPEFLERYEVVGHICRDEKVRPYAGAVCSMCRGSEAKEIVKERAPLPSAPPAEPSEADFATVRAKVREQFDADLPHLVEMCSTTDPACLSARTVRHWVGNAVAVAFKLRAAYAKDGVAPRATTGEGDLLRDAQETVVELLQTAGWANCAHGTDKRLRYINARKRALKLIGLTGAALRAADGGTP